MVFYSLFGRSNGYDEVQHLDCRYDEGSMTRP